MDRMEHLDDVARTERLDPGDDPEYRDHFERQLTQLMHTREQVSFGPGQRNRLRARVVARRRVRAARRAAGCVLAVAGLGAGLFLWPHGHTDDRPSAPRPRPLVSPTSGPGPSPTPSGAASGPPSSSPTTQPPPDAGATTSDPPSSPGSTATTGRYPPSATATSSEGAVSSEGTVSPDETTTAPATVSPSGIPPSATSRSG
ncbi:hypothetical protein [Streptomyces sp. NPDC096012]|uniref:hypothetical protein n=1 Tax=Streptomyces sp. NPDC096012 TaxID=3155684 RepID=UPI00336AACE6